MLNDRMYLFGGIVGMTQEQNDMYYFDFEKRAWFVEYNTFQKADPIGRGNSSPVQTMSGNGSNKAASPCPSPNTRKSKF